MTLPSFRTAAALLALASATAVQAHMPYVLPTVFDLGKGDHITVQSSFAEDAFVPEVAMRDAPFHLIGPDGKELAAGPITHLRDLSIFEANTPADGTYRVTTGQRAGRKGKMFKVGDKWEIRSEAGKPPVGAQEVEVQSMTLAEAYVTRGQPTDAALKPANKGLEIQAITHPNSIAAQSAAAFVLLFDGKPLADADITVFRGAGTYDGRKIAAQIKSGAAGKFTLKPQDAGTYLILVRHRDVAPAGAETPYRSYTYTLTFDVA